MSANDLNTNDDAEMTECDGEKVVTMMDVLQEQQEFEEDANAVLGASDDKNCTYSKGYVKRQALYACLTCCSDAKDDPTKRAGVCLACSLNCHENHELVELYTKRNFRCDCGNPKLNSHPCQFTQNKTDLNEENSYNQNFSGLYCICHRPYPDPESTVEEEMIQCIVCEDWLHTTHLEATVPANDQYSEMICKACMEKNEFLHDYSDLAVNIENSEVDIVTTVTDSAICNDENVLSDTAESSDVSNEKESKEITKVNGDLEKIENSISCDTVPQTEEKITDKPEHGCGETPAQTEQIETENKTSLDSDGTEQPLQNVENSDELKIESTEQSIVSAEENSNKEMLDSENSSETKDNETNNTPLNDTVNHNDNKTEEQMETSNDMEKVDTSAVEPTEQLAVENETSKNTETAEAQATEENGTNEPESSDNQNIEETNSTCENSIDSNNKQDEIPNEHLNKIETEVTGTKDSDGTETSETKLINEVETTEENTICNNEKENDSNVDLKSQNGENEVSDTIDSEHNEAAINKEEETDTDIKEGVPTDVEMKENTTNDNDLSDKENTAPLDAESEANENKRKLPIEESNQCDDITAKKPKLDDAKKCTRPKGAKRFKGATFWPSNFRQKLCTCNECISMYKDLSVLFLIDPEDTVTAYENLGKEKINGTPATQYEKGLQALSSLDRVQQINALTEYNKMRDKLLDFLKSFKDRKEIVKEEDIKAFFAGMKPKREPDGVYFCR